MKAYLIWPTVVKAAATQDRTPQPSLCNLQGQPSLTPSSLTSASLLKQHLGQGLARKTVFKL